MGLPEYQHISLERNGHVTTVWLDRPEVHNAFGPRMIEELGSAFEILHADDTTRAVILRGRGKSFSAGADVNWMRDSIGYTRQQNVDDATRLALMLERMLRCDKPVVCRVHGLAFGGAMGLLSAADIVVAADDTTFAFSEVKLGIVPAVISPFVVHRIGPGHARALFVTGERFGIDRALRAGLVHESGAESEIDDIVNRVVEELQTSAPGAIAVAKHLATDVAYMRPTNALDYTAETIATKRTDAEGQEGLNAFLEKRRPSWMPETHNPKWVRGEKAGASS